MRYLGCDLHWPHGLRQRTLHRRTMVSVGPPAPPRIPSLTFATNSAGGYNYIANDNSLCSGYLWSTSFLGSPVGDGTCGGLGAYCQDWDQPDLSRVKQEERWDRFNQKCASGSWYISLQLSVRSHCADPQCLPPSGYCDPLTVSCAAAVAKCNTVGCDCTDHRVSGRPTQG